MANYVKKRNWVFILYPDSAPENWVQLLNETGLRVAISPLHDRDVVPDTGELKKAHYHIILCYEGPTTYNAVQSLTVNQLNSTIPKPVESIRGSYRYFTHEDFPDKAQYEKADIMLLNGFNIQDYVELTKTEIIALRKQIQAVIREQNIFEYSDLLDYLLDNDYMDFYDIASSNTLLFNTYITSRRNKVSKEFS